MKSLAELQAIRDKARAQISVREGQEDGIRILVGMACLLYTSNSFMKATSFSTPSIGIAL